MFIIIITIYMIISIIIIIIIIIITIMVIVIVISMSIIVSIPGRHDVRGLADEARQPRRDLLHTRHSIPPSEIDLGLCLAVLAGSGGKY